jgi:glycosyltransferase involved in cell wall biosynthesis
MSFRQNTVAVIIPCYCVKRQVLDVIAQIGPEVDSILVVDDACPEGTGAWVQSQCKDPRVQVLFNAANRGVGGATMRGYKTALVQDADLLIKLDGDGQMNSALIPGFLAALFEHNADYVKGNRFYRLDHARSMPRVRLIGNLLLSFMTKVSSGYWQILDPTNGYTVLRAEVACELPFERIEQRFFFESDLLCHLNLLGAVVQDFPMRAVYGDEQSNLQISRVFLEFFTKNIRNTGRRIAASYFLKDINLGSAEFALGMLFLLFGVMFGGYSWMHGVATQTLQSSGTVMLAALPTLIGLQLLVAFFAYDVNHVPTQRLERPDVAQLRAHLRTSHDADPPSP